MRRFPGAGRLRLACQAPAGAIPLVVQLGADAQGGQGGAPLLDAVGIGHRVGQGKRLGGCGDGVEDEGQRPQG